MAAIGAGVEFFAGIFALIAVVFVIRGSDERLDTTTTFDGRTASA